VPDETVPAFEDDVASRVDAGAAHAELRRVLARLRPEEREVVGLYLLADLTYTEVAEALGVPVGTVRSRLSRARSQLRNLFPARDQLHSEQSGSSDE
jgi:RNA polymerase sigma-70 factor (ECF subfamily)